MSIQFDVPHGLPSRMASSETAWKNPAWYLLFLEHLDEFATLAWYLVANHQLVEETIQRTLAQLEMTSFDASTPLLAYKQAKEELITQAIAGLSVQRKECEDGALYLPSSLGDLPDLPRLAFVLKLVLRSSEAEVARFLDVTPSRVRELVQNAIDQLSVKLPVSFLTGCYDA